MFGMIYMGNTTGTEKRISLAFIVTTSHFESIFSLQLHKQFLDIVSH